MQKSKPKTAPTETVGGLLWVANTRVPSDTGLGLWLTPAEVLALGAALAQLRKTETPKIIGKDGWQYDTLGQNAHRWLKARQRAQA